MKRTRDDSNSQDFGGRGGRPEQVKLAHNFKANFNDHFETSILALRDIYPFLDELRQITRPSCPEAFTLYDPYYCTGKVRDTWKMSEFGITRVIHENRDFYEDIKNGIAPPNIVRDSVENVILEIGEGPANYDVCVTNPPYSENHIERFLKRFAIPSKKPWAMLVPDYIATKPWYIALIDEHFTTAPVLGRNVGFENANRGSGSRMPVGLAMAATIPRMIPMIPMMPFATEETPEKKKTELEIKDDAEKKECEVETESGEKKIQWNDDDKKDENEGPTVPVVKYCQEPFYVVPKNRYEFEHPVQAGRDRSHFKSLWIVSGGRRTTELLKSVKAKADTSKVTVASGRVELTRQTAAPGAPGSAALIPNAPRNSGGFNNNNFNSNNNHPGRNKY